MTTTIDHQQAAAQALAGQQTYREHLHRGLMLPMEAEDQRLAGVGQAFWPTRRDIAPPDPFVPIVNCQRCGRTVAPTAGWWCGECWKIVPALQVWRGMSMVMIAASGEFDPSREEWIQDYAPWMMWQKMEIPRLSDDEMSRSVQVNRRDNSRTDRKRYKYKVSKTAVRMALRAVGRIA